MLKGSKMQQLAKYFLEIAWDRKMSSLESVGDGNSNEREAVILRKLTLILFQAFCIIFLIIPQKQNPTTTSVIITGNKMIPVLQKRAAPTCRYEDYFNDK